MCPELIVPDLTGFELKPYVSYRTDIEIEKRFANFYAKFYMSLEIPLSFLTNSKF